MKNYKVVIDTEGSDKGPEMIVKGAALALEKYPELSVVLVGKEDALKKSVEELGIDSSRVEYINATDVVTNYDSPAAALFAKPESSLVKALEAVSVNDEYVGLLNAGNTGALIAGAIKHLSTPDLQRPALAAVLPSESGGFTCLVDTGATVDCTAQQLLHFARLGTEFMHTLYGIESPRVGLLSNGAEDAKGNKTVKEAHALLRADEGINFIGNLEGTNALSGECDVLVTDGFAGNVLLKTTEGIAKRLIKDIIKYGRKTGDESVNKLVGYLVSRYDFNSLGGGILLGVRKPVVKAHGAANEQSILNTLSIVLNLAKNKTVFDGR
jgi:glycerol-3-phosphate acyltransferase PlsX